MPSERKICETCAKDFLVLEKEQAFYARKSLPHPTECHKCRQDKRLSLRNERNLCQRTCDKCKAIMISPYRQDSPYIVYCQKCFWEYVG